jgi:hypothetical protein
LHRHRKPEGEPQSAATTNQTVLPETQPVRPHKAGEVERIHGHGQKPQVGIGLNQRLHLTDIRKPTALQSKKRPERLVVKAEDAAIAKGGELNEEKFGSAVTLQEGQQEINPLDHLPLLINKTFFYSSQSDQTLVSK